MAGRRWRLDELRALPFESAADGLAPIGASLLTPHAVRRRFQDPAHRWMPERGADRGYAPPAVLVPAAVLIAIVAREGEGTVLLTHRTEHLRSHSGQIAFPGGRAEPDDRDAVATALRETREEIGLASHAVDVIGRLPEYRTGTGYRVTPVVGLVESAYELRPDANEVAAVFEVPLAFLMDPRNHQRRRVDEPDGARSFFAMPYFDAGGREHFIWGATAAMLRNLYRFLGGVCDLPVDEHSPPHVP